MSTRDDVYKGFFIPKGWVLDSKLCISVNYLV